MTWWTALPGAITMIALMFGPGWLLARLVGLRSILAIAVGPPITMALSGGLAIIYDWFAIPFRFATQLAGFAAAVVITAVVVSVVRGGPIKAWRYRLPQPESLTPGATWLLLGAIAVAAVFHIGPMISGIGPVDQVQQTWDGVFHHNAVRSIQEHEIASSLGGLRFLYDGGISPYYPATWHGFVAVTPLFPSAIAAANVSSLVLILPWLTGSAALARVVLPTRVLPALFAPFMAVSFVAFPVIVITVLGQWPYALAHSMVPAVMAVLVVVFGARGRAGGGLDLVALSAVFVVGAVGVALSHGSGAFTVILFAAILISVRAARHLIRMWRQGQRAKTLTIIAVVVAAVAVGGFLATRITALSMVLGFDRDGADTFLPGIFKMLTDVPYVYWYGLGGIGNIIVTMLAAVGIWRAWVQRWGRWLVVAFAVSYLFVVFAAGPEANPLRGITGFWYTQPSRLAVLAVIPLAVLAAFGAAWVSGRLSDYFRGALRPADRKFSRLLPRYGAPLLVVLTVVAMTMAMRWDMRTSITESAYLPDDIAWGTIASNEELEMIERADHMLPSDAVVVGDPFNGAAYLYAVSGVEVTYPQLGQWDSDDLQHLGFHFDDIYTDPRICEIVRDEGITHVYTDTTDRYDGSKYSYRTEGLANVEPGEGFNLVDRGGTAALWELTYCNER